MTSTTAPKGLLRTGAILLFWLVLWQVAATAVGHELLVVSPVDVVATLVALVPTADFWSVVGYSFGRIVLGFVLAVVVGIALAVCAGPSRFVADLVSPVIRAVRSVPVFSFIILVLIWADSSRLSVVISFLMVMPIIYANVLEGIAHIDPKLVEVARVFRISRIKRLVAIDIPGVLPFFTAACQVGLGLCWKSGISGEVIGLPAGSIGERLYQAKIFLSTRELFAWTLAVICLSFVFEKAVLALVTSLETGLARAFEAR